MEIIKKCNQLKIDPTQYYILKTIHNKSEDTYLLLISIINHNIVFKRHLHLLIEKNYVKVIKNNIEYKFIDIIKQQILINFCDLVFNYENTLLKDLFEPIEESISFNARMYEKFPKGIKIMNKYLVRSGFSAFDKKLTRFINEHKHFSLETIELAFDLYISKANMNRWEGATIAEYVIYRKDGTSERSFLESFCEEVKDHKKEDIINNISGQISMFDNY